MANFVVVPTIPTNVYIAGLTTEPANPNPVRWENSEPLKYFFDDTGFRAWSAEERAAASMAFAEWQAVANINFILTTNRADADIIQVLNNSETSLGQTSAPADGVNPPTIEYSVIDNAFADYNPGGDTFVTLVHEIGHSIGLYHPHGGTTFPGVALGDDQDKGTNSQNQHINTVMSYAIGWDGQPVTTSQFGTAIGPMAFDIAAIQSLYGVRAAQPGDTVYALPSENKIGVGWDSIWDTGGTDTLTAAGATGSVTIDLRAATLEGANAGGIVSWQQGIVGGFTIANGVVIENAIGGASNDSLTGNDAANLLTGGGGNDNLNGGGGNDTAVYSGINTQFSIVISKGAATTVQDRKAGGEGADTLTSVENIDFANDKDINLGILSGVVNVAAPDMTKFIEMYIAYFNRAPDAEGLFYWGTRLSEGMSLPDIAASFFVQDETKALYPDPSNTNGLVTAVYNNFLGRTPDVEGLNYWINQLDAGAVTKGVFMLAIINGAKASTGSQADVDYITGKANLGAYFSVIKGMSNVDNAKVVMALYDGSSSSTTAAKNAIDGYYASALDADNGEVLISVIGVLDDPFAIA